jgi:putative intracellular protease/amidase
MRELARRGAALAAAAAAILLVLVIFGVTDREVAALLQISGVAGVAPSAERIDGSSATIRAMLGLDGAFIVTYAMLFLTAAALWRRAEAAPYVTAMCTGLAVLVAADVTENLLVLGVVQQAKVGALPEGALAVANFASAVKWMAAFLTIGAFTMLPPRRGWLTAAVVWVGRLVVIPAGLVGIVAEGPARLVGYITMLVGLFLLLALTAVMFRRVERAGYE